LFVCYRGRHTTTITYWKLFRYIDLEEHFGKEAQSVDHLDGITLDFGDWWFNVRPSNTEPLLRLNLEANSRELMEQKRDEVLAFIHQ